MAISLEINFNSINNIFNYINDYYEINWSFLNDMFCFEN